MSKTTTSNRTSKRLEPLRPMTEAEVMAAALADPDAKPLTPDDFKRIKRIATRLALQPPARLGAGRGRAGPGCTRLSDGHRPQPKGGCGCAHAPAHMTQATSC